MSPIDPRSIRQVPRDDPVPPGTLCPRCDYSLEGLAGGGKCPECGTPIRVRSRTGVQPRDNLADAPVAYLDRLRTSLIALAVLGVANAVLQGISYVRAFDLLPLFMATGGAAWAIVVIPATPPRPFVEGMRGRPADELPRARLAARVTQWAWCLQGLLYAAMVVKTNAAAPAAADYFRRAALGAQLVGLVGFAPLCLWFAHLADWAQNTGLAGRLRAASVLVGIGGPVFTLTLWAAMALSGTASGALLGLVALFALFGYEAGLVVFIVAQLQLAHMANWALVNAKATIDRDLRVLERRARRTFTGQAPEGSLLAEMTASRGERALDPCAGCGYDLTGLPPGERCPECGREQEQVSAPFFRRPELPPVEFRDIPLEGNDPE